MEEDAEEVEEVEVEEVWEVDHWVNAVGLVTVQTGPLYVASGDTASLPINQMETRMLGNAGLVRTAPPGHQFAPGLDIVNWEEVGLEGVLEVAEECLVVGNVEREDRDLSQGLLEADPKALVEGDAREKVLGHLKTERPDQNRGGSKVMEGQVTGML